MIKKIENLKENISNSIDCFACPICGSLFFIDEFSLKCEKGHSFDLSKKGYVNFLTSTWKEDYDKALFNARNVIIEMGFFAPLISKLGEYVSRDEFVIDVGCGEGSHILEIAKNNDKNIYFGLDISKDAIKIATNSRDVTFMVGDLAKLPFKQNSIDCIFNIFSPSKYKEFKRILKPNGKVVKVVPTKNYLKEIREFFNINTSYSNEKIISHFEENFDSIKKEKLSYTFDVKDKLPFLFDMTPLTKNIEINQRDEFIKSNNSLITVEVEILIAR